VKTLYALLVGIDAYDRSPLRGCRNDIDHVWQFLTGPGTDPERLRAKRLEDADATRDAVVDGFRAHLAQAGPDDTALFWFSGHGSSMPVPERYAHLEPSGRMQSLVCVDSRRPGRADLGDKELAVLIAEVAASGAHVVVVLDCCHAAGGTRGPRPRGLEPMPAAPPAELLLPELGGATRGAANAGGRAPDHVGLFACASDQFAYEITLPSGPRGAFSLALLSELRRRGSAMTYRELVTAARARVENVFGGQVPVVHPAGGDLADQPFLGGEAQAPASSMVMRYLSGGWEIDAGSVHGLTAGPPEDPTTFAVHGVDPPREAVVEEVQPHRSLVRPTGTWPATPGEQYPVVLTRVPVPATAFAYAAGADPETVARVRAAALGSPYLREARPADAELLVDTPAAGTVRVTDAAGDRPLLTAGAGDAVRVVADLTHIAKWRQVKALDNPASRLAGAVGIEVVGRLGDESRAPADRPAYAVDASGGVVLTYRRTRGEWVAPQVFLRLRNTSGTPLYCVLLDLTDRFRLHPRLFEGDMVGAHYAAAAGRDGGPIQFSLPDDRPAEPGASATDWLKLLVSERPFNSAPFSLPHLGATGSGDRAGGGFTGELDRLGLYAASRDADLAPAPAYDWWTTMLTVTTRIP
jgi:hypothetical protein